MSCWREPTDEEREIFNGINTVFITYMDHGADIGSSQHAAGLLCDDAFMVMMTSRCYFHKEGWLKLMVDARVKYGSGLYGCSANHDTHRLHVCTRAYAMDSVDFKSYPHIITNRLMGPLFEIGEANEFGNLMEWMETTRKKPARLVFFDQVAEKKDWFTIANRFRDGDQSNMLAWDKHTDLYRDATDEGKVLLKRQNVEKLEPGQLTHCALNNQMVEVSNEIR